MRLLLIDSRRCVVSVAAAVFVFVVVVVVVAFVGVAVVVIVVLVVADLLPSTSLCAMGEMPVP